MEYRVKWTNKKTGESGYLSHNMHHFELARDYCRMMNGLEPSFHHELEPVEDDAGGEVVTKQGGVISTQ